MTSRAGRCWSALLLSPRPWRPIEHRGGVAPIAARTPIRSASAVSSKVALLVPRGVPGRVSGPRRPVDEL